MKKIFITLLLSTILLTNGVGQQISATSFNKAIIHEDFNTEGDFFPIVTTTENYFILDKGDYLLSRNNEDSEYAMIANNSSADNFVLKTAVRIGPSNNKKASIGIIIKAQKDGKGAIIFEINKKGEYRIKQLLGNIYKTLSGSSKQKGWVKNKTINGVDEYNFVEIRTENNIYDVYINSDYLTTFFIPDYISGSCGIIISPGTKARIAYYYINIQGDNKSSTSIYTNENTTNVNTTIEELNKKIKTLEKNNATLNNLNTEARGNQDAEISNLTQKNADLAAVTIEQEKEIASFQRSITDLKNNNSKIKGLEKTISDNSDFMSKLNTEKNTLTNDVATLTETTTRLNTKNTKLASVTIEQEKEIASLQRNITDLKSNNSKIEGLEKTISDNTTLISKLNTKKTTLTNDVAALTKTITRLNTNNTELASVTIDQEKEISSLQRSITDLKSKNTELTNDLNKVNKSSNSRMTQLTTEISSLQSEKKTLATDLTKAKKIHKQTKNGLSKSVTNKIAEIKELTIALNNAKQQLKSANKTSANLKKCSANSANLSVELKQANNELSTLRKMQAKHDEVTTDLNTKITDLNSKMKALNNQLSNANTELIALNTTNAELKELFILKDFEVNGVKPSDLTKQTNTYPTPKKLKGNSTIYTVQFGVYMQIQPYSALKGLDEVWYETTEHGTYVYLSGQFKSPQKATAHKNSLIALGYPNAFVVTLTK